MLTGCAEGKECTCKDCPDKKSCHKGESQCEFVS